MAYDSISTNADGTRKMAYQDDIKIVKELISSYQGTWDGIDAESVARMRAQNRFHTGLDIARYTAKIMRRDMAAYDADPANYTQSLGCWHGFVGQQKLISIKKHFGSTGEVPHCRVVASPASHRGWAGGAGSRGPRAAWTPTRRPGGLSRPAAPAGAEAEAYC